MTVISDPGALGAAEDGVAAVAAPIVAVVGRPNVGKSTLVNRIIGRREAIVEARPGVTRDRKVVTADWAGYEFTVIDTGGWMTGGDSLDAKVSSQAERAMAEATVILFVVDATVGVTAGDDAVARMLRRSQQPVLVVANKVDSHQREADIWDFVRFGLGDPWPVSALHGRGTGDLLDQLVSHLPDEARVPDETVTPLGHTQGHGNDPDEGAQSPPDSGLESGGRAGVAVAAVAIVGRPNVGKSTLFNQLIGDERSIVHDLPGTTRDTVDTVVETAEGPIRFIDTAGMRRKSRIDDGPEYYSLVRALQAIDSADAALLVVDAAEGVTHQDQRLAERIDAAGSPVVIVLNKWDLIDPEHREQVVVDVVDRLGFLAYAPILKVSARSRLGVHKLLPALGLAIDAYHRRVPTRELNQLIAQAQAAHAAPVGKVLYATQGATDPPTFTLFTNKALPPTYLRYLERRIREHFKFGPTPLKLRVRKRGA
jgi:GTP-binding protein